MSTLTEIVGRLPRGSLRAVSRVQRGEVVVSSDIEIDFDSARWRVTQGAESSTFEHTDGIRSTPEGVLGNMAFASNLPDLGMKLLLAEPLAMWGRHHDDYRVHSIEPTTGGQVISFVHKTDPVVRAAALFDERHGLLVRLVRPTDAALVEILDR